MITLLLVLFLATCFLLAVVVLLQAGKGGGLAAGFGGSGTGFELLGGRQTATFLHQATRWLGGTFLVLAFLIAWLTSRGNRPGSLIEREFGGQPQPVEQAGTPADLPAVVPGAVSETAPAPAPSEADAAGTAPAPAATPAPAGAPPAPAAQPAAPSAP